MNPIADTLTSSHLLSEFSYYLLELFFKQSEEMLLVSLSVLRLTPSS
jgi:hypothetical protein